MSITPINAGATVSIGQKVPLNVSTQLEIYGPTTNPPVITLNYNNSALTYMSNDGTYFSIASNNGATGVKLKVHLNAPDNSFILEQNGECKFSGGWIALGTTFDTGITRLAAGSIAIGNGANGDVTGKVTLAQLILSATQSPASGAAGTAGELAYDSNYIYICIASGTWKRAALTGGY
jgi:hypothetical protein